MADCPKFLTCSAPICPLDPDWRKRKHLQGERVCFFLTEHAKTGAGALFDRLGKGELYAAVSQVIPEILDGLYRLKTAYQSAANSGSRMAMGQVFSQHSKGEANGNNEETRSTEEVAA